MVKPKAMLLDFSNGAVEALVIEFSKWLRQHTVMKPLVEKNIELPPEPVVDLLRKPVSHTYSGNRRASGGNH